MEYRWLYSVPSSTAIKEIIPGNEQLLVYFYPPILDGGTPITGYEYSLNGSSFIFVRNTVSPMIIRGLTNGTTYEVVIRAVNIVGHGPPSEPVDGTPATAPSHPIITGMIPGNQQLTVAFTPPSTGGSPIIGYQYSTNGGIFSLTVPAPENEILIDGLTNGQLYQVVIRAINAFGSGYPSNMMTGVPSTIPSEPIITGITPSNEQLIVYFTVPSDGGSPITSYRYSATEPYQWIDAGLNNPITITGLTNGTPYPIRIQAVNINGEGTSEPVDGTPATVPGIPQITGITRENGQLLVTFTPPSLTGGSPITGYQYSINGGTFSSPVPAPENQILITGLTNGQLYQVIIRAVNIIGAGLPSNTESGTPATTPSAPRITRVIPGDQQLTVYFTPSFNGGSPITGYQYSTNNGVIFSLTVEPVNNVILISGLTNGIVYQVIIRAVNEVGDGANSNMVTKYPVTVPSAPSIIRIAPSTDEVGNVILVMFMNPPTSTGGSPITDYQYSIGDSFISIGLPTLINIYSMDFYVLMINEIPVYGTYGFVLRASNTIGSGAPSEPPLVANTDLTTPDSPTIIYIEAGNTELIVDFEPPYINGGSPIIFYQYSVDNGVIYTNVRVTPVLGSPSTITITGLINDKTYDVIITAVNQFGPGGISNTVQATPASPPSAPTITGIIPGDNQLIVSITPPLIGNSLEYQYSINGGMTFSIPFILDPVHSFPIIDLTNGTSYPIVVRAVNRIGTGPNSNTVTGTPGVPTAPIITTITPGEKSLIVAFTPPSYGVPFTGYQYSTDNGLTFAPSFSPPITNQITITNLIDGQSYPVVIRAINGFGNGIPSIAASGTPGIVPAAPTITGITPGNGTLSVAFTDTASIPITSYECTATPSTGSPIIKTGTTSPILFTGLTNGTSYSVVVRAINSIGTSNPSIAVSGTPGTVPGAPTITTITPGNGQLSVAFTPTSTGGSQITSYQCTATPATGSPVVQSGATSPILFTGLTNGTSYSVVVRAVNSFGTGPDSTPVSGTPGIVPVAPVLFGILSGNGQLSVGFCPVPDTNPPIIRYECIATLGASSFTQSGTTSPIVITGLLNGSSYSVVVRAFNTIGESAPSNSLSGTPGTPSAPRISQIIPGIGQLSVTFVPSTSNGGFTITGYQYSTDNGVTFPYPIITVNPFTITGLTNGTAYPIVIQAVNQTGPGPGSLPVSGTPVTIPSAPTITGITPGVKELSVAFTLPFNGGSTITSYQYSTDGTNYRTGTTSPMTITVTSTGIPLTDGTTYPVIIRAINAIGIGTPSTPVNGTTSTVPPSAPTITGIISENSQLSITFTPPTSMGGGLFIGYEYSLNNGFFVPVGSTTSSLTIPNLSNNTLYHVRIRALNILYPGVPSNEVDGTPGVPSAPTITKVIPGYESLTIDYIPSTSDGGFAIITYQYSVGDSFQYAGFTNPIYITGLTNTTPYSVTIRATNSNGGISINSNTVKGTPGTPSAPTITNIEHGNQQLTVTFTPSTSDGGIPPITGYQYSIDNGITFPYSTTTNRFTITGLTNGTTYQIVIRATNPTGPGVPSIMVPGTPSTVPSAPTITGITPGNGQLSIAFTLSSTGGSAITGYQYSIGGSFLSAGSTTSPFTIIGLTNGTPYSVIIEAINSNGAGASSTSVNGTPGVPTAPTITGITPGNGQLSIAFTPPLSDGGSPILNSLYSTDGVNYNSMQTITSPIIITFTSTDDTPLINGTSYPITIKSLNMNGKSDPSNTVSGTPVTTPSAPTNVIITPGNGQLSVAFTPPSTGGSAITGYQYSTDNGASFTSGGQQSPITIIVTSTSGIPLTNGTTYPVVIRATNSTGAGASSTPVNGTPFGVPSAPFIAGIVAGNQQLLVSYCPPITNGGSAITSYRYSIGGSFIVAGASPFTITGLTNGTTYQVIMYAVNSNGGGDYSNMVPGTPA